MDQTNPWREAISAALFEKQLPPIGEGEAPENALHRLLKAEGEWALMNHNHGEISPYTRNQRWEDASTVNAKVKEAMAHPSLTFDPVLARHVGLTGQQVLSRTTALTASQVQAQIEQERIRAVRFDDRNDGMTDALRYGFLNSVPPAQPQGQLSVRPAHQGRSHLGTVSRPGGTYVGGPRPRPRTRSPGNPEQRQHPRFSGQPRRQRDRAPWAAIDTTPASIRHPARRTPLAFFFHERCANAASTAPSR